MSHRFSLSAVFGLALAVSGGGHSGCGMAAAELRAPSLAPLEAEPAPAPLAVDHFHRDRTTVSEDAIREILQAPVYLEGGARIGILHVADSYEPRGELPLAAITKTLGDSLSETGYFDVATEMASDWPADRGTAGLRELAARYRCDYLLLYRHRFVEETHSNHFSWLYLTVVGIFAAPSQTVETAGVMEATLFDVKTGTLLFTAFERVHDQSYSDLFSTNQAALEMQRDLVSTASVRLAEQVTGHTRRLALAPGGPAGPPLQHARATTSSADPRVGF